MTTLLLCIGGHHYCRHDCSDNDFFHIRLFNYCFDYCISLAKILLLFIIERKNRLNQCKNSLVLPILMLFSTIFPLSGRFCYCINLNMTIVACTEQSE